MNKWTNALAIALLAFVALPAHAERQHHVGHYAVMTNYNDDDAGLTKVATTSGLRGVVKRYSWRELEPTPGNYNLAILQHDLTLLSAYGLYLVLFIEDKSFSPSKDVLPDYLLPYSGTNAKGGRTVARWDPYVVDRYKRLMTAIAGKVGSHPSLEGIATPETAPSLSDSVLKSLGYTAAKYRDAYIDEIKHIGTVMPNVRTFWYANFIPGGQDMIDDVVLATRSYGVVMGCPDVWPENDSLVARMYPYFTQLQSAVPLMAQVEHANYIQKKSDGSYYTALELFNYGKNKLYLDYVMWVNELNSGAVPDFESAKPVIANNPQPINALP